MDFGEWFYCQPKGARCESAVGANFKVHDVAADSKFRVLSVHGKAAFAFHRVPPICLRLYASDELLLWDQISRSPL
jgi:hypothetical protein